MFVFHLKQAGFLGRGKRSQAAAAVSAATVPGSHQSVSVKPSGWQNSQ